MGDRPAQPSLMLLVTKAGTLSPGPGLGIVGSSGSKVLGPGHFMGSCPEKQGLGTTPAVLESKHKKAYLQPPREMPVVPKPYGGHSLPGGWIMDRRFALPGQGLLTGSFPDCHLFSKVPEDRRAGKGPKPPWHLCI